MKKLLLVLLFISSMLAEDNSSIWDLTSKSLNSIWKKSKELGNESWEETKKYTNIGKNLLLEESLLTSINLSLDTNTSEVKEFKIGEDDSIKMVVKLQGEKEDLILDIKHYNWFVSEDEKHIIFEDIKYDANIKWIKYLLDFYIDKNEGYIKSSYSISKQSLLYSLKNPIEKNYQIDTNYAKTYWDKTKKQIKKKWIKSDKKDITKVFTNIFDKERINIDSFKIDNEKANISISLIDAEPIELNINSFAWATANKRTYIIFKDMELETNRAWIKGILKSYHNSFYFTHSKIVERMLKNIKPPIKGKKQ